MWALKVFIAGAFLTFIQIATADLAAWLEDPPKELKKTAALAKMHSSLFRQVPRDKFLVMVLPTDAAWKGKDGKKMYSELSKKKNGNLAQDLMLGSSCQIDAETDYNGLIQMAKSNGGFLDTAYGTMVMVRGNNQICTAENDENFEPKAVDCTKVNGKQYKVDNILIFTTNKIIIDPKLKKKLTSARRGLLWELASLARGAFATPAHSDSALDEESA